ncbi:MAG: SPOR domain-containing protein [Ignavibacteriales bacterium]|nr:SPOR domain-containing protein [Ignavibacteriales bacterium]
MQRKIPRTAGIIYVEGLIASNENESIRCFRTIVDSFPRSEWADDALARLFEYNLQSGTFAEAEQSFKKLENTYPSSPYVTTGYLNQQRTNQDSFSSRNNQPRAKGEEWAVQIGAFSLKENAVKLQQKLVANGYRSTVYENLLDGKNLLYLVWVGTFDTADEARPLLKELKTKFNINGVLRMRTSWKKW